MGHLELIPWHNGPKKDERAKIQHRLNRGVERIMSCLDFGMVQAIPVQGTSSNKTSEGLVGSKAATSANDE
ncbi:hypothetical protein PENSUB_1659 [Penicillium subrubescens]|uniref:Uncharacterized protein n=1 Tax=Penicillium subrubescens TaxID=1316194 RepID=A0A1Q5UJV1_9EURO|nr:hypothetical protein PENSUB_1659 [Penicillium subrubescens]